MRSILRWCARPSAQSASCRSAISDAGGAATQRLIWPFALGFFDRVHVVVAWCELRQDFRHFRTDRIADLSVTDIRYARRRQALLKAVARDGEYSGAAVVLVIASQRVRPEVAGPMTGSAKQSSPRG